MGHIFDMPQTPKLFEVITMGEHLNMFENKGLDLIDLDDFMTEFMECNGLSSMVVVYTDESGTRTKIEKVS